MTSGVGEVSGLFLVLSQPGGIALPSARQRSTPYFSLANFQAQVTSVVSGAASYLDVLSVKGSIHSHPALPKC